MKSLMSNRQSTTPANVLFFIGTMGGGGAERQMIEIMRRLDRVRFRPLLFLHHKQGELLDDVPRDVPIFSFWDHFSGTWRAKWHRIWGTTERARWKELEKTIRRESVDLVYNQTYLATLDAAEACRASSVPRISVCVGDPLEEIRLYTRGTIAAETEAARSAFATADRVVAVSQGLRQRLIDELGIEPNLIEVAPNMVDVDWAMDQARAETLELEKDRCHLLTVARLSPEKGHAVLLEAIDQLVHKRGCDDLLWHIVGSGPLEDELRADVSQRQLQHHVNFAGFQQNPYPYYGAADLFCLPSLHEAFGCVLIEALACGQPILATNCPSGPREILEDGKYGKLVQNGSVDEMAAAIEEFRANRQVWRDQAAAGREHVRMTYSCEVALQRLEDLFSRVLQTA